MMTSREKVLSTIEYRNSGKIPFSVSSHNSLMVHGQKLLDILLKYPDDFHDPLDLQILDTSALEKNRQKTDSWGCVWETTDVTITGVVIYHPLADWNTFSTYKMPTVTKITDEQIDAAKRTGEKYPIWGSIDMFFQVMENIRGIEQLFMDFYTQPEEVQKLIDRMLNEYHIPALEEQLRLKPDIVGWGDDWGTQKQQLLINPALWRQYFKPVYKKITNICHQAGAKIWFHSCGYTMEILEELIEIGIDVINPQMAIMDSAKYGMIARNRITVFPDLDRQNILIHGNPDEVTEHIVKMYNNLGTRSGGLIGLCSIEPDMPLINVEAMLETISTYEKT